MTRNMRENLLWILLPLLVHTGLLNLTQIFIDAAGWQTPGLSAILTNSFCILLFGTIKLRCFRKSMVPRQRDIRSKVVICFLCLLLGMVLSAVAGMCMKKAGVFQIMPDDIQGELHSAPLWLQITGFCMIVPVGEELVFRVFAFDRMCILFPAAVSAAGSALLFALGHGSPLQSLYAFFMGLLLAGSYYEGGSAAVVLFHAGANLAAVFVR